MTVFSFAIYMSPKKTAVSLFVFSARYILTVSINTGSGEKAASGKGGTRYVITSS